MKKSRIIFFCAGLIILALLFAAFGIEDTVRRIQETGHRFWYIVLIYFFNNLLLAYAWLIVISRKIKPAQYPKIFLARIAGDCTSAVNALGAMAGEALKAAYIKDIVPFSTGIASVIMDRTIHSAANMLMVLAGVLISLFILPLPLYVSFISLIAVSAGLYALIIIMKKQKQGFSEYLISLLPSKFADRHITGERREKAKKLDDEIKIIFSSGKNLRKFTLSMIIHFFSIVISGTLEIYLIVHFMQDRVSFPIEHAMFIYIFGFVLTSAAFFMPANMGTSEGSYSLALKLLGYDDLSMGLSIGIIRRLRTFVWSAIGMALLFHAGLFKKEGSDEKKQFKNF